MKPSEQHEQLRDYYRTLYRAWGPQQWWPARTRFEVIAGAYLTQNTAWTNVEKALQQLRGAGVLSLAGIRRIPISQLERLIRPAGYFRQKAHRLKTFVEFADQHYSGSLKRMFARPTRQLRAEVLALNGIGPETADSVLLYAGNHPVFVVDTYTRRVLDRHRILPAEADYEEIRELFESALSPLGGERLPKRSATRNRQLAHDIRNSAHRPSPMSRADRSPLAQIYNEMHGLLVGVGKHYCWKKAPSCENCPLQRFLPAS